ncbi:unnamed protein product [Eruca vesicaria subsp. sativa]|uniref:F-box domain-containing protein n=1 Tax=Eruca vesicaria subsp. sativa TaxID=29727 RepID=A0ABC8IW99_ERUVS|nr:unnamed protein product [Eruca vesicaria subsp. sativa]
MNNNEEATPHEQNNKMVSPTTTSLSLPDDILISFLSRVSRLYYPTFSLVSKSFRSLIASPELYQTRSFLNRTESCLYVCLRSLNDSKLRWFTLCRVPDRKLTNFSEGRWESMIGTEMDMGRAWVSYCVVKNVLVYYHERDSEFKCRVNLADYGGKMVVLWDTFVPGSGSKNKMIWCAEVGLENHEIYDVCGEIEWFDVVLRVSKSYELVHVIAATV